MAMINVLKAEMAKKLSINLHTYLYSLLEFDLALFIAFLSMGSNPQTVIALLLFLSLNSLAD